MAHHGHHHEIVPPKRLELPRPFMTAAGVLAILGAVLFAITLLAVDVDVAWKGAIIGFWFTMGLGIFGPFFASIQHLPRAGWSVSLRRIVESFGWYIPVALLFGLAIVFFAPDSIYLWKQVDAANDPFLVKKLGFLNQSGFLLATVLALGGMSVVFYAMRTFSLKQDEEGGYEISDPITGACGAPATSCAYQRPVASMIAPMTQADFSLNDMIANLQCDVEYLLHRRARGGCRTFSTLSPCHTYGQALVPNEEV